MASIITGLGWRLITLAAALSIPAMAVTPVVLTVPFDPNNPATPHDTYAGATVFLGATVPNIYGSGDTYQVQWSFGDGSPLTVPVNINTSSLNCPGTPPSTACVFNISQSHVYSGPVGTIWTATVTVTDLNSSPVTTGSNSYLVEMQPTTLVHTVNLAIDNGLWFLHTTMWRTNAPGNSQPVNWGGWDDSGGPGSSGCIGSGQDCTSYGGVDATNVEAFEVKGHLENGPATDPYTDDVSRGLARTEYFLIPHAVNDSTGGSFGTTGYSGTAVTKNVTYNPANFAVRCSDGTQPSTYGPPAVCATGTPINYNPTATSCTTPPCQVVYDQNHNGQLVYEGNDSGDPGYQVGMFVTALVASGNPSGVAKAGPAGIVGQTYLTLVTDMVDGIGYCQYYGDNEYRAGYDNGGAWQYYCAANPSYTYYYDDNSPSQWNATALIAANRGFGVSIQQIIKDTNQVWTTWSQEPEGQVPISCDSGYCSLTNLNSGLQTSIGSNKIANNDSLTGAFGYNAWGYEPWGPFADTPSGMVQLALDNVGRSASGAVDQRWNWSESFMHDNFCNGQLYSPDSSYYPQNAEYSPRYYMYGMFSLTKAMLLHDPGGVLTPITFLSDEPSGAGGIDWYGAQASAGAPCDGIAQSLVSRQQNDGSWYYYSYTGAQFPFDTAWALIMLNKSVFVACINNLNGRGTPGSGSISPTVNLTWSSQANATSYAVLRSTTSGGPYTQIGTTNYTAYSDRSGLTNGRTYYYVVQPVTGGNEICQSNQATIVIP